TEKKIIFINTKFPISLILTDKSWHKISKNSKVRANWIIKNYGKAHSLFYAIRYSHNFISLELVDLLIKENVILSRYLVQRLLLQFGKIDDSLIELKIQNDINVNNINVNNNNNS